MPTTPVTGSDVDTMRHVAIDHHHDLAPSFEQYYRDMADSRFTNVFTYGRCKVDALLDDELSRLPKGSRVLDVGCGTGAYLSRFERMGLVPSGVEPAPAMREAARRSAPDTEVLEGIATRLPFADATFDAVVAIEVLRYLHIEDNRLALAEAHRVLRPGGLVFITLVNRWALDGFFVLQRLRQLRNGRKFDRRNPHCEFYTPSQAERELRAAGFVNVRTEARLLAPMRVVYKLDEAFGASIARVIEPLDDRLHTAGWSKPFAGHLIAIAERAK